MDETLDFETDRADTAPVADDLTADTAPGPPPVDEAPHDQASWDLPEEPPLPEGGFFDELPPPPPPPPGAGAGDPAGNPVGAPLDLPTAEAPPAPEDVEPLPPAPIDLGGVDLAPPGTGDAELGDQPPLPPGLGGDGGGQSPFPLMGAGAGTDPAPMPPIDLGGVDLAPPGTGDGEQGDQPPLPPGVTGDAGGQSPVPTGMGSAGGDTEATDRTEDLTTGTDGAGIDLPAEGTGGDAGMDLTAAEGTGADLTAAGAVPASLAALLADGVVPADHVHAFLSEVAGLTDEAGNVSMTGLVDALAAHGAETSSGGDRSLEEVCRHAKRVDLLGEVEPGRVEPLRVVSFDDDDAGRTVTLRSRGGDGFRLPAADLSSLWSAQGSPLVATPAAAVTDPAVPAAPVEGGEDGGMSGGAKAALAGAVLLPVVAGGGLLAARRLRR